MKKYYRDFYGASACITVKKDGSVKLTVSAAGTRIHNKEHKSEKSARAAMNRIGDAWREVK